MKPTFIFTTLASITCFQTVSAAYWTVRYRDAPLQSGRYSSEYEYWGTNLTANGPDFGLTHLACYFSANSEKEALLYNRVPKSYMGCGEPDKVPRFSPMISAVGSDTELYALAVQFGADIPCVLIEYGTGYKTYICSELMPVVDKPLANLESSTTTRTEPPAYTTFTEPVPTNFEPTTATPPTSTTKRTTSTTKKTTSTTKKTTSTTKKTTTKTAQPTATNTPCTSGYRGKRNGKGPNGACCSHSDDCLDTCVAGTCGVHP